MIRKRCSGMKKQVPETPCTILRTIPQIHIAEKTFCCMLCANLAVKEYVKSVCVDGRSTPLSCLFAFKPCVQAQRHLAQRSFATFERNTVVISAMFVDVDCQDAKAFGGARDCGQILQKLRRSSPRSNQMLKPRPCLDLSSITTALMTTLLHV